MFDLAESLSFSIRRLERRESNARLTQIWKTVCLFLIAAMIEGHESEGLHWSIIDVFDVE